MRDRVVVLLAIPLVSLLACGGRRSAPETGPGTSTGAAKAPAADPAGAAGEVRLDGSSTVYPVAEAVAEEFRRVRPSVRVTVGISGTGGGFKKLAAREIDAVNASRPIKDSEAQAAAAAGVTFVEVPIAYDGLTVVVSRSNDFVDHLTVEELRRLWEPDSTVRTWADLRATWPARDIHLFGAGADSGTFDYFTEAIVGEARRSRSDYNASEDDNMLVQGVAGDVDALGYFGYAYFVESADRLRAVPVDGGAGPVAPSPETVADGTYVPLSRPLFVYVATHAAPETFAFVDFGLEHAAELVPSVGYVPLPAGLYAAARQRLQARVPGTVMTGPARPLAERFGASVSPG